jgi:sarcosine oxidase subunit gamma
MADRTAPRDVVLVHRPLACVLSIRARDGAMERAARALGVDALPTANCVRECSLGSCLWVRPDEWLLVGDPAARASAIAALESAIGPDDGAVVDISESRVVLELSGARSRDVLASCCPLDLHPRVFAEGRCAQSLVGKAPVLLQLLSDPPRWRLLVRPSLVAYVTSWLGDAIAGV